MAKNHARAIISNMAHCKSFSFLTTIFLSLEVLFLHCVGGSRRMMITELPENTMPDKLRQSEDRFAAAIHAIGGVLWTNSPEGKMVGLQPSWGKLTGQTYDEYQGYGWTHAVHPDDRQAFVDSWNEAVINKHPYEFQHRIRISNGQYRRFTVKAVPVINDNGSITEWVGVHTDITEQHKTLEAIAESQARFENLIQQAGVAMVVLTGPHFIVEIVNEAYAKLVDKKTTELHGKPLFEVLPRAREHYLPMLQKVIETGEPLIQYESPYSVDRNRKMYEGFVHLVYQPYRDVNGNVVGVMAIHQDVTASVKARRELQSIEARFRSLIEEAPIATCLFVGSDMRIEIANDAMINYWGKGRSVMGKPFSEALPELYDQPFLELLGNVYTTGATHHAKGAPADIVIDGLLKRSYFDYTYKPIRDVEGKVYAVMNMAIDVTEEFKAYEKLAESEKRFRNLSEKLEEEVETQTRQLRQSNTDLQQFAHVASHDLKEPVRKISTFTGRIQSEMGDKLDKRGKEYLGKIQHATARMMSMIDGVLAYSSVDSTLLPVESVDLNNIVENIASDLELLVQEKHATILHDILPRVNGAPVLLYQLFYNLINNSIKFAKADEPVVIDITSETLTQDDRDMAMITVSDNGIGFDEMFSNIIFETFTRLNPKDKYEGTGLGLALCKKIVQRHGGTIEAKSRKGLGSTFIIRLPIIQNKHV